MWNGREIGRINIETLDCTFDEENLGLPIAADDYAYVRYASGSTGQAKGGLKTHRHVLHAVMNATNNFHICAEDRSTLVTRDSSLGKYAFEVLLNGAALYPYYVKEEGIAGLAHWLAHEEATFYYSFPTAFRHFVGALSPRDNFPKLRLIRLEGEPVYQNDVELYKKHFAPGCLLVNSFSSTETGPVCLYFADKQTRVAGTCLPAGYPVDGMKVLVLDESGQETACDQPGEIVVKSSFLASGYWQRPELTEAKFLPDRAEEQVHFTGDLGWKSADGCLELGGRKDFQTKIRSFRVDVGEGEAVLAVHPEIKEVTVVAREDASSDTILVAYLVPHRLPAPTTTQLRKFLAARLADYMIPSVFVVLEKLPLLSTGKIDRRSLPRPGKQRPALDEPFVAPRTPAEQVLARIWGDILGLEGLGIHDNLSDLGGHSLAASRVIARVIQSFQVELPVQALFDSPTVADMSAVITERQGKQLGEEELERLLGELETMSEEEAQQLVAKETVKG